MMKLKKKGNPLTSITYRLKMDYESLWVKHWVSPPFIVLGLPWKILIRINATTYREYAPVEITFYCCQDITEMPNIRCVVVRIINYNAKDESLLLESTLNKMFNEFISSSRICDGRSLGDNTFIEISVYLNSSNEISSSAGDAATDDSIGNAPNPSTKDDSFLSSTIPLLSECKWIVNNFRKLNAKSESSAKFSSGPSGRYNWNLLLNNISKRALYKGDKKTINVSLNLQAKPVKETFVFVYLFFKYRNKFRYVRPLKIYCDATHFDIIRCSWDVSLTAHTDDDIEINDILEINCLIKLYEYETDVKRPVTSIFNEECHADIKMVSNEGKVLSVHKEALRLKSPVFAAMFQTEMKENIKNQIELQDLSYETLKLLKQFMYAGFLPDTSDSNYLSLLYAADKYEMPDLASYVEIMLLNLIKKDNAIDILISADVHKAAKLKKAAMDFICLEQLENLCRTPEWEVMVANHSHLLQECFKNLKNFKYLPKNKIDNYVVQITPCNDIIPFLLEKYYLSDITLVSKDQKELKANRIILAVNSSFFRFKEPNVEIKNDNTFFFYHADKATLELLVKYAYEGFLPVATLKESIDLFEASCIYDFPEVKALMEAHIIFLLSSPFDMNSVVRLLLLSGQYKSEKLKEYVIAFFCWGPWETLLDTPEWKKLCLSYPHLVNECLKSLSPKATSMEFAPI